MKTTPPKYIVEPFSRAAERVPEIAAFCNMSATDPAAASIFSAVDTIDGYEFHQFIHGYRTESAFVFRRKECAA